MNQDKSNKNWGGFRPGAGRKPIGASFTIHQKPEATTVKKTKKAEKLDDEVREVAVVAVLAVPEHEDPLRFLTGVMNSDSVEDRFRIDAAKALMPYVYAKKTVGEKQGKKEQVQEEAETNHQGTGWGDLLPSAKVQ